MKAIFIYAGCCSGFFTDGVNYKASPSLEIDGGTIPSQSNVNITKPRGAGGRDDHCAKLSLACARALSLLPRASSGGALLLARRGRFARRSRDAQRHTRDRSRRAPLSRLPVAGFPVQRRGVEHLRQT